MSDTGVPRTAPTLVRLNFARVVTATAPAAADDSNPDVPVMETAVVKTSFPLRCTVEEPAVAHNQLALGAADKPGTVSVSAPSSVIWSVTVGRGDPTSSSEVGSPRRTPPHNQFGSP